MIGKFQDSFQLSETEIPEIKRSWEEQGEYHVQIGRASCRERV